MHPAPFALPPSTEEALADPYFAGLSQPSREPSAQPVSKLAFEFERRKLVVEEVRELIYREILEYHPQVGGWGGGGGGAEQGARGRGKGGPVARRSAA